MSVADLFTILMAIGSLVILEGLLSADNALVLAVMVRHLPGDQQTKALRYGMWGAFIFRLIAIVFAGYLLHFWAFKLIGGAYLGYLAVKGLQEQSEEGEHAGIEKSFWGTVAAVEFTDIAFSIDSILAAVALAEGLPSHLRTAAVGGLSLKLLVVYIGGVLGIVAMRFVAGQFLKLLDRFPALASGAYFLVAWIGLKLLGGGLHVALEPYSWSHAIPFEMREWVFWGGMGVILTLSMLHPSNRKAAV